MTLPTTAPGRQRTPVPVAVALDVVLVLVFAAIGRATHDSDGSGIGAALGTALPFLVGTAVGWGAVRRGSGSWPLGVGPGVTVWLATWVTGLLLRAVTGHGVALSFTLVAGLVLAVFLVGWRAAATVVAGRAR